MSPRGNEISGVVSYRLARERLIRAVSDGVTKPQEVCDAQPELRRVAHHHGVKLDESCPICSGDDLAIVRFAFGSGLPAAGRLVANDDELQVLQGRGRPATCYLVEVCRQCWWNHLRESFDITGRRITSSAG